MIKEDKYRLLILESLSNWYLNDLTKMNGEFITKEVYLILFLKLIHLGYREKSTTDFIQTLCKSISLIDSIYTNTLQNSTLLTTEADSTRVKILIKCSFQG